MNLENKYIIEAGHVSEVYGPVQALRNYLIERADEFTFISHPFSYTSLLNTEAATYVKGKETERKKGHKKTTVSIIQWIKDHRFNMRYIRSKKKKTDLFIGVDNLNVFAGLLMKKAKKVDKVGYYIIDHMDRRFKNPLFNFVYEYLDKLACKKSDYVWALSERMAEAKKKKFRLSGDNFYTVPVGIELDKVDKFSREEKVKKKSMVLMSLLDETKGVQLLIDAMQDILKEVPEAELLIIGTGPYEETLKKQAEDLGLTNNVKFLGLMQHGELFKFIPHERLGMAPYIDDSNNYTYYADPTKPKEYLACGLPLVITDVPWIAKEVSERPMGLVCKYTREQIAAASIKLLKDDDFYLKCLDNAIEFTSKLRYSDIYDRVFGEMG